MKAAAIISLILSLLLGLLCIAQFADSLNRHGSGMGLDWIFALGGCGAFLVASLALFGREKEFNYKVTCLDDILTILEKEKPEKAETIVPPPKKH